MSSLLGNATVNDPEAVLKQIDNKTKQIDELLAGFDNLDNANASLTFIPSSVNKSNSCTTANKSLPGNAGAKSNNDEVTKTITITATSFKVEHHTDHEAHPDAQNRATPPVFHEYEQVEPGSPIQLHAVPPLDAKPSTSILRKSTFTTFRDEKRAKRRSHRSSRSSSKDHSDRNKDKDNSDHSNAAHNDANNNNNNSNSSSNNDSDKNKNSSDGNSDTHKHTKQRRVCFSANVKKEDGISAKLYGSPQYCIREGVYLRPKPREQIENEKRLLQMLGAPEELAGRSLPPGLLEEDWEEMYDPEIPNDYTAFVNARLKLEEWILMRKEQRSMAYLKALRASQLAQDYIESEVKREREHEKSLRKNNAKDKDKDKEKERDRDRSHRDRDRERDRDRDRSKHRKRDRDRERDRDRTRDRESRSSRTRSERERSRSRERERDSHRERDRERDHHRRSGRSKEKEKDGNKAADAKDQEYGYLGTLPTQSPLEAMHHAYQAGIDKPVISGNAGDDGNGNGDGKDNGNGDGNNKLTGIDKAAKMMAKFGWKRGDGLGKSKQGLKGCLVPVGGYNQLMSVQDPTNILLLQNMANKGEVDVHLKAETIEECKHFGPVLDCVIHETKKANVAKEQEVSVFVKFEYIESCMNALQTFHGRFFDGRRVIAAFFPAERFDAGDLDP